MTGQRTARPQHVTERQKARARLILLTLISLICPPLAGVRSAPVWIFYVVFVVVYSLWALRLNRNFAGDRRLGYLLCLTDTAILLPLLVWTSSAGMRSLLALVCVVGLVFSYLADLTRGKGAFQGRRDGRSLEPRVALDHAGKVDGELPLERALRVRLHILRTSRARFALVVLRIVRFEELGAYYGEDEADRLVGAVTRRGMRLLGPDAQHFVLPGGRVAFLFATGAGATRSNRPVDAPGWIDPYDVESLAMAMARKACEHLIDGLRIECVVGWASAPADGVSGEDLIYAADSGAQSAAAFRRVAGARLPVPDKTRVAAG
ncbi:MAG: hypothetical protein GX113_01295 [Actinobacteria bacterium]|nr:hypothetical protein [Actinomycetota bacterium]